MIFRRDSGSFIINEDVSLTVAVADEEVLSLFSFEIAAKNETIRSSINKSLFTYLVFRVFQQV